MLSTKVLFTCPWCWNASHSIGAFGPNLDHIGSRIKRSMGRGGGRIGGGRRSRLWCLGLENPGSLRLKLRVVTPSRGLRVDLTS